MKDPVSLVHSRKDLSVLIDKGPGPIILTAFVKITANESI